VKYSQPGGTVFLRAELNGERVRISVADEGIGIPEADLPRIFERFYRADKARSRELGGTGLGLSIVKHIVLLHGGTVEAESEPGKGTTISVLLPANSSG
jgi:two-component system phosphate regulon sensor histidine kinase PhoR